MSRIGIDLRMYRSEVAGIGRYSQNLIKNLLKLDQENQYVLFMTAADIAEAKKKLPAGKNYRIIEVNVPHYSLSEQIKLGKIIEKEKCDLVFFTNTNFPIRYKGKFIVTIHDLTLFFYPKTARKKGFIRGQAFKYVLNGAVTRSAKIITDSENTKKDILKVYHPNPKKISVIYLAADDKVFTDVLPAELKRIKIRYKIDSPIILYVGQFRGHKNIPNLVRAFEKVRRQILCKLVLIGKKDENYHELLQTIDKSPYKLDIIEPGFVSAEELSAWYQLSSCFCFPSLYEGFGLPGLEAMMASTAVISSSKASLPEIYGDAALYFDPLNINEMAGKIKTVLTNTQIKDDLILKGKLQVKKFSWEKTAKETLAVIKEVLNTK